LSKHERETLQVWTTCRQVRERCARLGGTVEAIRAAVLADMRALKAVAA
jgi:hypothetical protein